MMIIFREFYIPITLITLILGYQVSSYLIWQYFKNKSKAIGLNKFVLAFGIFIGISVSSLIFRIIYSFYIEDQSLYLITANLASFVVFLSIVAFLILMCLKMFSIISNITLTRIITIILLSFSILLIILGLYSPINTYILLLNVIGFIYILYIKIRLLKVTTKNIARRFKKTLIGELIYGIGLLFGGEVIDLINPAFEELYSIALIFATIMGLTIIFLGIYRFPLFLEFGWRENLLKLFVIDQNRYTGLYVYNFKESIQADNKKKESSMSEEDREFLLSKGILGVDEVVNLIVKGKKKKLELIERRNLLILVKYGDPPFSHITYALLVKKKMKSLEFILELIKDQFQDHFKEILPNLSKFLGNEQTLFSGFDPIVSKLTS
ncbi:MAG: hypothetical protein GF383_02420 [Candidatus Lokiarchaeota archaeon]|nr:hypothetical protein [Candidatus Lokiarchaeota archaeon]MBD3338267.1 hypothetical protein [Candidatus Lokiarchaeota archaeon]